MPKYIDLEQGTPEWLAFRKNHIGGSDIASIMGISPWKSAFQLWEEKTGAREEKSFISPAMQRGRDAEAPVRDRYMQLTGNIVKPKVLEDDELSFASVSLDGINMEGTLIYEGKRTNQKTYDLALRGKIPDYYMTQCQWGLYVSKAEKCDIVISMDDENEALIEIFPNIEYQKTLVDGVKAFWKMVQSKTPPEKKNKDYEPVLDEMANEIAVKLGEWKRKKDEAQLEIDVIERELEERFPMTNVFFPSAGVKMGWFERQGNVDWDKVKAKYNISESEVELYRKAKTSYSKFVFTEGNRQSS